jgi:RimJ/RimL family protein N-acetyltransferase
MISPVVSLRPVEDADLPVFLVHEQDPESNAMAVYPPRTPEAFYEHWATIRANPDCILRSVLVDGILVGRMMTWVHDGEREVGYWIGREFWGHGYATAGLRLLLEEVTDRPIVAHVALDNIGSRRVLEHCGFSVVFEGVAEDGIPERTLRLG